MSGKYEHFTLFSCSGEVLMHFMQRKFFSKEDIDTKVKIIMSKHIHAVHGGQFCLGSEKQYGLGLDTLAGKAGEGIMFGVDNYAYDTSTEHIKYWHMCTNICLPGSVLSDKSLCFPGSCKSSFLICCTSK